MFFTSCEKALPAHIISILRGLVLIVPAAFLLARLFGLCGVWLSFTASESLCAVCSAALFAALVLKKRSLSKNKT